MLWTLRPPRAIDLPFLYNSWLKSHRDSPAFANMTHTVYYKAMHDQMEAVFRSPSCVVTVACAPGEEDVIYGYSVGELVNGTMCIHFVYVKHPFRTFGIGKALEAELLKIPHSSVAFSCWTKGTKAVLKDRKYEYQPFLLWSHK